VREANLPELSENESLSVRTDTVRLKRRPLLIQLKSFCQWLLT